MAKKNTVHVVGTGTIGEPLIGLFTDYKNKWNIDEVTFHKRTPSADDRAMVQFLIDRGARLVADEEARSDFARLGNRVSYTTEEALDIESGTFVCMRRANDVSDTKQFIAAPEAGKHDDHEFGTHHARDAYHLFQTLDEKLDLFSSAIKINTQYMHTLWYDITLGHDTTLEEAKAKLRGNPHVAVTSKRSVNQIFSFGRDHGYFGRILSQTVVPMPTHTVPSPRRVVGFCYTPQDENLAVLRPYMFREV